MKEYTSEQKAFIQRLNADRLRNAFYDRPKILPDDQMAVSIAGRIFEMQREIKEYEQEWEERDKYQGTLSDLIESLKGQCQMLAVVQGALENGRVNTNQLINNKNLFLSRFHETESIDDEPEQLDDELEDEDIIERLLNSELEQIRRTVQLQEQITKIYDIMTVFADKLKEGFGVSIENLDIPKPEKKPHLEVVDSEKHPT